VVVGAGESIPVPGGAIRCIRSSPMPSTSGSSIAELRVAAGVRSKDGWTDFTPAIASRARVEGRTGAPGTPLRSSAGWLAARRGRRVVPLGSHSRAGTEAGRAAELREAMMHVLPPKDAAELDCLRHAARDRTDRRSGPHHATGRRRTRGADRARSGVLPRGAERTGYGTIVGAGSHPALSVDPAPAGDQPTAPSADHRAPIEWSDCPM